MTTDFDCEEENNLKKEREELERRNIIVKKWTDLLLECDKEYQLKYWDGGDGVSIIVKENLILSDFSKDPIQFEVVIDINNNGFVLFSLGEEVENLIAENDEKKKGKVDSETF